eukprot:COSAG05_NODE_1865_length_3934_cov_6.136375_2_plen_378_part_00
MLKSLTKHLARSAAADMHTDSAVHDLYGNDWRRARGGGVEVRGPSSDGSWVAAPSPAASVLMIAADSSGFIWAVGPDSLYRLNPRAPGTPGAGDPLRWAEVEMPDAAFTGVEAAGSSFAGSVVVSSKNGERWRVVPNANDDDDQAFHVVPVDHSDDGDVGRWAVVDAARLPVGNHDHFLVEAAGRLWIAGGLTHYRGYPAKLHVFDELFSLDLAAASTGDSGTSGKWTSVKMPAQRAYCGLTALNEQIYVLGGSEPQDAEQSIRIPQDTAFVYDITTSSWSDLPKLPQRRMDCNAAAVRGRVYLIGGATWVAGGPNEGPTLSSCVSYAPGEKCWREEPPLPVKARQCCSCVIDDKIYTVGNFAGEDIGCTCSEWSSE